MNKMRKECRWALAVVGFGLAVVVGAVVGRAWSKPWAGAYAGAGLYASATFWYLGVWLPGRAMGIMGKKRGG